MMVVEIVIILCGRNPNDHRSTVTYVKLCLRFRHDDDHHHASVHDNDPEDGLQQESDHDQDVVDKGDMGLLILIMILVLLSLSTVLNGFEFCGVTC